MSENRPAGPSGKPVLHVIHCNSMKEAKEQAQRAGQGNTNSIAYYHYIMRLRSIGENSCNLK